MAAQQDLQHIETIFNSFDADKSGTIELSQLINVAQALGEKIEENELKKIMKNLDINGDGKISFDEFKFWWMEGRKGKLGDLVYLKAKSMKLTNMFLSQFQKAGVSLTQFSKEKNVDIYDIFVGFGEPEQNGLKLEGSIYIKGDRFKQEFQKLKERISWMKETSVNFVLVLPTEDPKKAKEQIQGLLKSVIDTNLLPFLSEEEDNPYLGIKLEPVEKALIFHIQIREALTQIFSDPINKADEIKSLFDQNFYIFLRFALKTNFNVDELLQKSTLIEGLLKGFQLHLSGQAPNSMLKKFREVVEANQTEGASINFLLSVLLRNAFLRLKLRSPLMVSKFFEKIGIKEILNECPTLSELLQQLSLMPDLQKVKYDVQDAGHLVYQALKLFKNNFESGIEFFIQRDDILIHISTDFKNASQIFNVIFNEV